MCSRILRLATPLALVLLVGACDDGSDEGAPQPDVTTFPTPTPNDREPVPEPEATPRPAEPTPTPATPAEPELATPDLGAASVTLTEIARAASPTAGAAGPDANLWIAERTGTVRIVDNGTLSEPVATVETTTTGERGLLGLAFDDGFDHLYLSYTNPAGDTRVDELAIIDGLPDQGTQRTVFAVDQPFSNHNGGDIAVGPDGMVYIGLGDGGGGGDPLGAGQDLGTLLGKLVRVDPRGGDPYAIPDDNPFVDDPDARDEIWAYGLRNPWRFSFDAATGDLWIADVGQADREEVNWMPAGEGAGANYGWNLMEGTLEFAGPEPDDHVPPVFEYDTASARCAITGGYVYRGEAVAALRGAYVYSDYCEGVIRALDVRDGQTVAEANLGVDGGQIVSFAQGPDLELYALDLGGAVLRVDPT